MAHFYGRVTGRSRTPATRCGTKSSGLVTEALSWQGSVIVNLSHDAKQRRTVYDIFITDDATGKARKVHGKFSAKLP